jgi:diguanylate cyclase (GGDEF)-like protein/PAS domain S-box-containing protein
MRDAVPDVTPTQGDLRAILNALPAMVGYWDADLRNRMGNDAYVEYFGITPEELRGKHIREVLGEELFAKNFPYMQRALAGEPQLFDREIPTPSGELRYTQASYIPDVTPEGVRGFFVLVTDITERRRAEQALAVAEARFRKLFDSAPIGMFLVDHDGRLVEINPAGAQLLGSTREALLGRTTASISHPDDAPESQAKRRALFAGELDSYTLEKRYVRDDGGIVWAQLDVRLMDGLPGLPPLALGQVQDITERRLHQQQLEHLAHHDPLTGLLNRRGLAEALARQCAEVDRYGAAGALLVIDLDRFKPVNDAFGHQAGDDLISEIGARLRSRLRESDVVARLGGDEFAVILPRGGAQEADRVAHSLLEVLRAIPDVGGEIPVTASIGTAPFMPGVPGDAVLINADHAMYEVKSAGGDGVAHHAPAPTSA